MSGLQMRLNREIPFSRVFAGSGEQSELDKPVKTMQHGLYFGADDELLIDHPYNANKIALIKTLGVNTHEPATMAEVAPTREPVNPEVMEALADKTDAEIHDIALELVKELKLVGMPTDFLPKADDRDGSVRFIAKHTS